MAFLVLDQSGELVEETLPHVLKKCRIGDLVIQQCLQDRLGLEHSSVIQSVLLKVWDAPMWSDPDTKWNQEPCPDCLDR